MAKAWPIQGLSRKRLVPDAAGRTLLTRAAELDTAMQLADDRSDPEHLHDIRVALRRLRASACAYRSTFPKEAWAPLRAELAALFRASSPLRDLDVQTQRFAELAAGAPAQALPGLDDIRATLAARTEVASATYQVALDEFRVADVTRRLVATTEAATGVTAASLGEDVNGVLGRLPDRPLAQPTTPLEMAPRMRVSGTGSVLSLARRQIRRRLRAWEAAARAAGATGPAVMADLAEDGTAAGVGHGLAATPPALLHELRIAAKKLRYTLELFAPVVDPALAALAGRLGALQDLLGEVHDADLLAAELVEKLAGLPAEDPRCSGLTFVLGDARAQRRYAHATLADEWGVEEVLRCASSARRLARGH